MGSCCIRDTDKSVPSEGKAAPQWPASAPESPSKHLHEVFQSPGKAILPSKSSSTTMLPHIPGGAKDKSVRIGERRITIKKPIQRKTAPVDGPKLYFPSLPIPTKFVHRLFESKYLLHPNPLKLTSGTVLVATQNNTQITRLVVKIGQGYAGPNQQIISDLTLLVGLDHPNILAADAVFYDERAIFVLSDIFNGLRLVKYKEIAERQDERVVKRLAVQMIRGVGYAHAQNCLLKSISILNMIFFAGHSEVNLMLKLVTLSKRERGPAGDFNPVESSIMYTAPEALSGLLTEKSDIWSCGVILYFLLTNSVPFLGDTPNDLKDSILSGARFSRKRWSSINPLAKSLISAMLTKDPLGRPTAAECIAHPWLQETLSPPPNLTIVMANLRKFQTGSQLQFAMLRFIVTHALGHEEKQPLLEVFDYINTSGSGILSLDELTAAFAKVNRAEFARSLATDVLRIVDLDGNGTMDFTEFLLASTDYKVIIQDKKLKIAFDLFDPDSSGSLTIDELKSVLKVKENQAVWKKFLKEVDKDQSGTIGFEEFSQLIRSAAEEMHR